MFFFNPNTPNGQTRSVYSNNQIGAFDNVVSKLQMYRNCIVSANLNNIYDEYFAYGTQCAASKLKIIATRVAKMPDILGFPKKLFKKTFISRRRYSDEY